LIGLAGWLVGCSPCGGGASLSKLTKRKDRESRLCDCCYSGKGTAIGVRNLIGICERAVSRRRRWQEMREAEQDKNLGGCVRGEAAHIILFDTRQEQEQEDQKARRRKKIIKTPICPRTASKSVRLSRKLAHITCPPSPFPLSHPTPWRDTSHERYTIAKGPLDGPTIL